VKQGILGFIIIGIIVEISFGLEHITKLFNNSSRAA